MLSKFVFFVFFAGRMNNPIYYSINKKKKKMDEVKKMYPIYCIFLYCDYPDRKKKKDFFRYVFIYRICRQALYLFKKKS